MRGAVSFAVGLVLIAVPVGVFGYTYLADDDPAGPSGDGTRTSGPGGPTVSGPTDTPSSPHSAESAPPPLPSASGETCVPDTPTGLTVVSFNIESAHAPDGSVRLGLLARTLAAWRPDIVLLQEVDKHQARTARVDMPAYLGERLGFYSTFAANLVRDGGQYGTALLSRFPILDAKNTPLPRMAGDEPRGLLHTVLDVDGTRLSVYVTHLQHTSVAARMRQITTIRRLVADDPLPMILGGDFNATPGSAVLDVARTFAHDAWPAVGSGSGRTVPRTTPHRRIDYLLQSGLEPLRARVLLPPLSDHRALRARFALGSEQVCVPDFG